MFKATYETSGVFSGGVISSTVNDSITITAIESLDSRGYLVILGSQNNIPFANVGGSTYYIGLRKIETEVPETATGAVEVSPFLGTYQYSFYEENVGEIGSPDNIITNDDNTITFSIDSVVGSMDNTGRTIRTWLTSPVSGNTGWYEDCTVQYGTNDGWSGSKNYITTTGNFHQVSLEGSISTTLSDYRIWLMGITITLTNISSNDNYIYLGTVQGNGPTSIPVSFDQSGMISLPTSVNDYLVNIYQLSKDYYGDSFSFSSTSQRNSRNSGNITDGDTTPDLSNYRRWRTVNSAPTTITGFSGGLRGDIREFFSLDDNTTLQNSATLVLKDGLDFVMNYSDGVTLLCAGGTTWLEIGRVEGNITSTSSTTSTSTSTSTTSPP